MRRGWGCWWHRAGLLPEHGFASGGERSAGLLGSRGRGDVTAGCGPGCIPGTNPALPGSAPTQGASHSGSQKGKSTPGSGLKHKAPRPALGLRRRWGGQGLSPSCGGRVWCPEGLPAVDQDPQGSRMSSLSSSSRLLTRTRHSQGERAEHPRDVWGHRWLGTVVSVPSSCLGSPG